MAKKKTHTKVLLEGKGKYRNESVWVKLISGNIEKGVGRIANDPINPNYKYNEKISWKGGKLDENGGLKKWAKVSKVRKSSAKKRTTKKKTPAKKTTTKRKASPVRRKLSQRKKAPKKSGRILRGKRNSPSTSATSVNVGTKRRGGDGKMYVCKTYKRGNKRVKRWVRA